MSPKFYRAALGAALAAAAASPAAAAPLTIQQVGNFGAVTKTIVDDGADGATSSATFNDGNFFSNPEGFAKFQTGNGVLTGVSLSSTASYQQKIVLSLPAGGSGGAQTMIGAGGAAVTYSAHGIAAAIAPQSFGHGCRASAGLGLLSCGTAANRTRSVNALNVGATGSVAAANLAYYVGPGAVSVTRKTELTAGDTLAGGYTAGNATYSLSSSAGTVTLDYQYLKHAVAAFDPFTGDNALTLDFGNILLGSAADPLLFEIFNIGDAATVGLDLDAIGGAGDIGSFATDLLAFTDLAAGAARQFQVTVDTSSIGEFLATYTLLLSDTDVGVGMQDSQLVLTLRANVLPSAGRNAVPEPAALGLLGLGLLGVAAARRRRRA